ncbi:amidohydrolase family protein (plasmid) [Streptomyces sp. AHU1]|uniref:amidohydrolase family protein n=1 Tax=Streptomyces sp. AHU1 TaxID=3377215 RepID=UPI003877F349
MRIDAHHHLWDLAHRDQPWTREAPRLRRTFSMSELRPSLELHAIDATVVVQTIAVPEETPELLALAIEDPHARAVVGWTQLTDPAIADRLAELQQLPGGSALVGLRHGVQDENGPAWLERPDVRRGIAAIGAAGLTYDLLVRPDQLPHAVQLVREMPDVKFVLDHAGNPIVSAEGLATWSATMTALAACPNTAVKLSGLVTRSPHASADALRPFADVLLTTVGAGRVMFGSDWPVCLLAADYDEVVSIAQALTEDLSTTERDAVFGTTAAHWYGITR